MLQFVALRVLRIVTVTFCVVVALLIYTIDAYFYEIGLFQQISLAVSASAFLHLILAVGFNYLWRCLWRRCPTLNDRVFPDWNGTWDVKINWQWEGNEGTVPAKAKIKQSLLKVSISLQSERSYSETLAVVPKKHPESARPQLHYLYEANPSAGYQDDNPAHIGAAILKPDIDQKDTLRGNYFTDRATSGHFVMTRKSATD